MKTSLSSFVEVYASERDLADSTIAQYRIAALAFERFIGCSVPLGEVTPEMINQHLRGMKSKGRADSSRHSRRRDLTLLLRAAVARGDLSGFDFARVLRVKVNDRVTRAWSRAQVEHLLSVVGEMRGSYKKLDIPKAAWWRSFILAAWDSGLRSCDVLSIEYSWIQHGCFTLIQHKTGRRHRVQLAQGTREAIVECMSASPRRALVWPLWGRREVFFKAAKKLLKKASLPGSMKWVRRASATDLEREHPGAAARHLGHKTPGLAERFYIDYDQLSIDRPTPRPLCG